MGIRLVLVAGVAGFGAIASVPAHAAGLVPSTPSAPSSLCDPVVSGASTAGPSGQTLHSGAAGVTVTVAGEGFGLPTCTLNGVTIGTTLIKPGTQGFSVNPEGSSITFTLPAQASGAVSVSETDLLGNVGTSNSNFDFIETPAATALASTPVEGSAEAVSGSGFTPFLPTAQGGLPNTDVAGVYSTCGKSGEAFPASVQSDAALLLSAPTTYCDSELNMVFEAPYDSSRALDCSDPSTSPAYNCVEVIVPAGVVDVDFFVATVSPAPFSTVPVGSHLVVGGSGFGPSGTAKLSGVGAPVRWSDSTITVTVPAGAQSGALTLARTTGDQAAVSIGPFYIEAPGSGVIPPPPPGSGFGGGDGGTGSPGGTGSAGGTSTYPIYPSYPGSPSGAVSPASPGFGVTGVRGRVAQPEAATGQVPASPEALTLSFASNTGTPGGSLPFTVALTLNGRPVSGAPVSLTLVSAPGKDASLSPESGTTDAAGTLTGTLHLSRTAGHYLVVAQSGAYSDEVTVLGAAPAGGRGTGQPFGLGPLSLNLSGNPVVVWLSVATGLLLLFGLLVNINVIRRFIWSVTARPVLKRVRGARAH